MNRYLIVGLMLLGGGWNLPAQVNTTIVAEGDIRWTGGQAARGSSGWTAGGWHSLGWGANEAPAAFGRNEDDQCIFPAFEAAPVQFAAGHFHSLARLSNGTVTSWGEGPAVPGDLPASRWVAAGRDFGCSIAASDSSIACWGLDDFGQASPPDVTGAVSVHCGLRHAYAVLADRSIVGWGANDAQQLEAPPDLLPYTWRLATGYNHTLAIGYNGTVQAWGSNLQFETTVPPDLGFVRSVAAGLNFSAYLSDEKLEIWGRWPWGKPNYTAAECASIDRLEGGLEHLLVIFKDGRIDAWGSPTYGAAVEAATARSVTAIWPGLAHHSAARASNAGWLHVGDRTNGLHLPQSNIVGPIDGGTAFGVGLTADGKVRLWGTQASIWFQNRPTDVNYASLAAGKTHALAWKADGTLVGMGRNASGQIQGLPSPIRDAAAAGDASAVVDIEGNLSTHGDVPWGPEPAALPALIKVDATPSHIAALTEGGELMAWGINCDAPCNDLPAGPFVDVHVSEGVTIGERADGSLGWAGDDRYAALSNWPPVLDLRTSPVSVMAIVPKNTAPWLVVDSLARLEVCFGAADSLDLRDAFADEEGDSLTLSLVGEPLNWGQTSLRQGHLVLEGGADGSTGDGVLTVRATDPEGLFVEASVAVRERPDLVWQPARFTLAGERAVESQIHFPIGHPFPVTSTIAGAVHCPTYLLDSGGYGVVTPRIISGTYRLTPLVDDLGCMSSAGRVERIPAIRN